MKWQVIGLAENAWLIVPEVVFLALTVVGLFPGRTRRNTSPGR